MAAEPRSEALRPRRRRWAVAVVAITAIVIAVVGVSVWNYGRNAYWWGVSDGTKLILADPMAQRDLLGLVLLSHEESEPVGPLGKPSGDFVINRFDPGTDSAQSVQGRLVELAERSGWSADPKASGGSSTVLTRTGSRGNSLVLALTAVAPGEDPRVGSRAAVRVAITFA